MDINEEEKIKREFQLERVVLFTDAVFAIILTLMVLDLKLPEGVRELSDAKLTVAFKDLIFKFTGYVVTFAFVARFWVVHLNLFRYLKDYDKNLLIFNLIFLFAVSLFPFAVPLITGNIRAESRMYAWSLTTYICIVYAVVFMQALIAWYLLSKRGILVVDTPKLEDHLQWKIQRVNLFVVPALIIAVAGFCYFKLPYMYMLTLTVGYGVVTGWMTKSFYPGDNKGPLIMRFYLAVKNLRSKRQLNPTIPLKRKKRATHC